jgi:CheY-like chemotaxis protein
MPLLAGISVFLVDDHADSREILAHLVTQAGGTARAAATAVDALEVLLKWTPDVLLLDISMPVTNGYELLETIRGLSRLRDVPAIAVTALAYASDRDRCLEAGFVEHVTKPYDPDALMALVARVARAARDRRATAG